MDCRLCLCCCCFLIWISSQYLKMRRFLIFSGPLFLHGETWDSPNRAVAFRKDGQPLIPPAPPPPSPAHLLSPCQWDGGLVAIYRCICSAFWHTLLLHSLPGPQRHLQLQPELYELRSLRGPVVVWENITSQMAKVAICCLIKVSQQWELWIPN